MTIKPRKRFIESELEGYKEGTLDLSPDSWFVEGAYLLAKGFSPVTDGFVRCVATEGIDGDNLFAEVFMTTGKVRMFDLAELNACFFFPRIILTEEEREAFMADANSGVLPYPFADFGARVPNGKPVDSCSPDRAIKETLEKANEVLTSNFYLVWSLKKGTPTKRHSSRDAAEQEAARLAEKHPGVEFFVVEAISRVKGYVSVSLEQLV